MRRSWARAVRQNYGSGPSASSSANVELSESETSSRGWRRNSGRRGFGSERPVSMDMLPASSRRSPISIPEIAASNFRRSSAPTSSFLGMAQPHWTRSTAALWLPIHDRLHAVTPLQIEVSWLSNSLGVVGVMPGGSAFGAVLRSIATIGEPGERLLNCFFWGSEDVEARSHEPVERDDP
jgi:hypothetical protein